MYDIHRLAMDAQLLLWIRGLDLAENSTIELVTGKIEVKGKSSNSKEKIVNSNEILSSGD